MGAPNNQYRLIDRDFSRGASVNTWFQQLRDADVMFTCMPRRKASLAIDSASAATV